MTMRWQTSAEPGGASRPSKGTDHNIANTSMELQKGPPDLRPPRPSTTTKCPHHTTPQISTAFLSATSKRLELSIGI